LKIRTLIVDDEPLGRERIRTLLGDDAEMELWASVRMESKLLPPSSEPGQTWSTWMCRCQRWMVSRPRRDRRQRMPAIILVTTYDRFAVKAFEVHALDYLLKSFDRERFQAALRRAKEQIRGAREGLWNERLTGLLEDLQARQKRLTRLVIRSAGRIFFLRVEEIDWLEAADNYVRIHAGRESHLVRETLQSLEGRLDPSKFLRIHRSTLVNLDRI
jgi:two-component system, LytTR family, response regulator